MKKLKMWATFFFLATFSFLLDASAQRTLPAELSQSSSSPSISQMVIRSSAFEYGNTIPKKYTCHGDNINPPLEFLNVPQSAQSLILIMEDLDVLANIQKDPNEVHWIVFNIDPTTTTINENALNFGVRGTNSYGEQVYNGPCLPSKHRYVFKLYALDEVVDLPPGATKRELLKVIQDHIIAEAELIGIYKPDS